MLFSDISLSSFFTKWCCSCCQASSMLWLVFSVLIFVAREHNKSACCNNVATFGSSLFKKLPSHFAPFCFTPNNCFVVVLATRLCVFTIFTLS
uniref:Uncharacterized protein n=1 Tax=Arundo donax TaxID=35708 RepID=A0A0A9DEG3_ARUDO